MKVKNKITNVQQVCSENITYTIGIITLEQLKPRVYLL